MEDIEAVVDEFERAEQEIMVSRSQLLEDQAQWAARISVPTTVLAVAVIVVGVLWLARQRADARVPAAERGFRLDLERQVESRTEQLTDEAVDRVLSHAQPRIEETGASIEVGRPLGTVSAHPSALELVLDNLVANAVKFVAPGKTPHVHIRSENQEDWVRLWVEDNGIGIDPSHRERIFEPFQRLHGVETCPGTGIGLAIVRRDLERMGGRCGVDAEAGRGSRFWIELRRADGKVAQ